LSKNLFFFYSLKIRNDIVGGYHRSHGLAEDGPVALNATALIVAIRTTKWPRQVRRVLERGAEVDAEIQLAANVACRVMTTDDEDAPKSAKILQFRNRRGD
jgi:hypothetical protein